jgi:ribosomal protein S18 acetylase RimI-like enzyme
VQSISDVVIRPYEPRDRARVRRICYLTGYMGEPVDWLWRDEESFAELFTAYYTDAEPESAFVAEADGVVHGYLLGCVDSSRVWNPAKVFLGQVARRQIAFRPGTAAMVWRSLGDVFSGALKGNLPVPVQKGEWPAHLHIDLLAPIRGLGVGAALIRGWLEVLEGLSVPGCHLETIGENYKAISFFESVGFAKHGRLHMAPGLRSPSGERHTVQLMARSVP